MSAPSIRVTSAMSRDHLFAITGEPLGFQALIVSQKPQGEADRHPASGVDPRKPGDRLAGNAVKSSDSDLAVIRSHPGSQGGQAINLCLGKRQLLPVVQQFGDELVRHLPGMLAESR